MRGASRDSVVRTLVVGTFLWGVGVGVWWISENVHPGAGWAATCLLFDFVMRWEG